MPRCPIHVSVDMEFVAPAEKKLGRQSKCRGKSISFRTDGETLGALEVDDRILPAGHFKCSLPFCPRVEPAEAVVERRKPCHSCGLNPTDAPAYRYAAYDTRCKNCWAKAQGRANKDRERRAKDRKEKAALIETRAPRIVTPRVGVYNPK